MSGDELRVIPEDLTGKATQIRGLSWSTIAAQPALISPDALITSSVAITNLAGNAESIWEYQEFGRLEGLRLAQTLDNVAGAYAEVDQASGDDIGSTMDVAGSGGPGGTVYPNGVDLPAPPHPADMPIPKGQLASDQMLFPPEAQRALEAGDDGASLRAAADDVARQCNIARGVGPTVRNELAAVGGRGRGCGVREVQRVPRLADQSRGFLEGLSEEADRIVTAHLAAKRDNEPLADEFERLQQEVTQNPEDPDNVKRVLRMGDLQTESEVVRNQYARDGQPYQIQPEAPPTPVVSGIPVTVDEHRRARKPLPEERSHQGPGTGQGGDGGAPGEGQPQLPSQQPAASPMSAAGQASQGAQQGGQQGGSPGGSQGGGQQGGQRGGASPGGGLPGAGMPGGGKGDPKLPTNPGLRPAAAGGGGGGASGDGGGGGGGVPSSPMQPAVGAETVAPTPMVTPAAPAAATGGATPGGAAGAGMGGIAPMHGAQGGGSGEKKRNPQLFQDEELYTEERPWTEAVIGNRVRRRGATDETKKESK